MIRKLLILLFVFSGSYSDAQSYAEHFPRVTLGNTEIHSLFSSGNEVNYKLYISYPQEFNRSDTAKKYPVVYLLDADYSFAITKNITDHLTERNHLANVILVGIAYGGFNDYQLNRSRDYTISKVGGGFNYSPKVFPHTGGASKFSDFMERELFPYVEDNLRGSSEHRTIVGHSFGGLFASWILLKRPGLFENYIINSPSLWYDDALIFDYLDASSKNECSGRIYFTVGSLEVNGQFNMVEDLENFSSRLEQMNVHNLTTMTVVEAGLTHNNIFPVGLTKGLSFIFDH